MNIKDVKIGDFVAQIEDDYAEIVRLTEENDRLSKDNELVRDANDRLCKTNAHVREERDAANIEVSKLRHESKVLQIKLDAIRKETKEELDVLQKSRAYWRTEYFTLAESMDAE